MGNEHGIMCVSQCLPDACICFVMVIDHHNRNEALDEASH